MYDYLIVGAGLYGATCANILTKAGKKVLIIDKRDTIAGNIYTRDENGIKVHVYGAHIFHTNDDEVWEYVTKFGEFNDYINSPIANYHGEMYHLPFNMNTFKEMWGVTEADEAEAIIASQRQEIKGEITNLEEQAISLVGRDVYEKLIKGYTQKQWGRPCNELPSFIIKRLPVRFTYDNNYFNAKYQGIPVAGYTALVEKMIEGCDVKLGVDYLKDKASWDSQAEHVIYTGPIDAYYDYKFGPLKYRTVRFETEALDTNDFQGNAVINYTDAETPFTRIIEHKWFNFGKDENGKDIDGTIISREYSTEWSLGDEPYYPVNDEENGALYSKYRALADEDDVIIAGRLGEYRYYDMDQVIRSAIDIMKSKGYTI